MYETNALNENWILLSEPAIHSPSTVAPGFWVTRTVRWRWQTRSQPRSLYLHQNGKWAETTSSVAGQTGYFATHESAERTLLRSEGPLVAKVCAGIVDAEVVIVRSEKREFQA